MPQRRPHCNSPGARRTERVVDAVRNTGLRTAAALALYAKASKVVAFTNGWYYSTLTADAPALERRGAEAAAVARSPSGTEQGHA